MHEVVPETVLFLIYIELVYYYTSLSFNQGRLLHSNLV